MPNYCSAELMCKGRKDSVDEFIRVLNANYNYHDNKFTHKPHFYRIFDCNVYDYIQTGLFVCARIGISCAWSVYCCMFPGEHTYYSNNQQHMLDQCGEEAKLDTIYNNKQPYINYGTNILDLSRKLNLEIEIISEELGAGFMEHYKVKNGEWLLDETYTVYSHFIYEHDTLNDYMKNHPNSNIDINEEEYKRLKDDGNLLYTQGSIPWEFDMTEEPEYDHLVEMVKTVDKNK